MNPENPNFKYKLYTERFLDQRALIKTWKKVHNVVRNSQNSDKDVFYEHCGLSFPMLHISSVDKSILDNIKKNCD